MNKLNILLVLCLGFFLGYGTNSLLNKNISSKEIVSQNGKSAITENTTQPQCIDEKENVVKPKSQQAAKATQKRPLSSQNNTLTKQQDLNTRHQYMRQKVEQLERQLDDLETSGISNAQMAALTTAPFDNYITHYTGKMRKNIFDFHQAEPDLDWGYNMQNHISDFVLTHYYAADVNLVSITCKQQQCELLIIENEHDSWQKIARELAQQPWWQFTSTSTNSGNSPGSTGIAIYTFLSK